MDEFKFSTRPTTIGELALAKKASAGDLDALMQLMCLRIEGMTPEIAASVPADMAVNMAGELARNITAHTAIRATPVFRPN